MLIKVCVRTGRSEVALMIVNERTQKSARQKAIALQHTVFQSAALYIVEHTVHCTSLRHNLISNIDQHCHYTVNC